MPRRKIDSNDSNGSIPCRGAGKKKSKSGGIGDVAGAGDVTTSRGRLSSHASRFCSRNPTATANAGTRTGRQTNDGSNIKRIIGPPSEVTRASCLIDPEALPKPSRVMWLNQAEMNCLSFGLQAHFDSHKAIICDPCLRVDQR